MNKEEFFKQAITNEFFGEEEELAPLLEEHGYIGYKETKNGITFPTCLRNFTFNEQKMIIGHVFGPNYKVDIYITPIEPVKFHTIKLNIKHDD